MSGTWIILDERGQQVGKPSCVPILVLKKGERISYKSDLFTDSNNRGSSYQNGYDLVEQINRKDCVAIIKTENGVSKGKYWHTFSVVGTNPSIVNETVEELLHVFGQTDVEWKDIKKKIDLQEIKEENIQQENVLQKEDEQKSSNICMRPDILRRFENWIRKIINKL